MSTALSQVVGDLDLEQALIAASKRGDLLPPRGDDDTGGEVGRRFHESLRYRIETDSYRADQVFIVPVPKPRYTTRPAAVLTLADRTVLQALVDRLAPVIETRLLDTDVVFAPRATEERRPWTEFENHPLRADPRYVVRTDIFGYYDAISHELLVRKLIDATGLTPVSRAVGDFLDETMQWDRGLPQGERASGPIASIFLDDVDRAMIRLYDYARSGDDIRIAAPSYSQGREAIAHLEADLRRIGLALNDSKTKVLRAETYRQQLRDVEAARQELGDRLHAARIDTLEDRLEYAESLEELEGIVTDQLLWGLYAGTHTIQDVIQDMAPLLQPDIVEIAERLFTETVEKAPGNPDALSRESFHGRLIRSLRMLSAAGSVAGLEHVGMLLRRFPDETNEVAFYLKAAAERDPDRVKDVIQSFLMGRLFRYEWQETWLYEALAAALPLNEDLVGYLSRKAADEGEGWFLRVKAAVLLGKHGVGDQVLLERMWRLVPTALRPDVIAAAAWLETRFGWARTFLQGLRGDAVHEVVVTHVRNLRGE